MSGNRKNNAGLILQRRDRQLFSELAIMRIIDREMAKAVAGFHSTTRANTRLLKLTRHGLLNRFFAGSVAAGRKAIYTLSPRGGVLAGAEYHRISRSRGKTLVGDLFIDHQMRINDVYLAAKHFALPAGVQFNSWRVFYQPVSPTSQLIPDGYLEMSTPPAVKPMFLEVDLGNQSMKVWERKTDAYLRFAMSNDFSRLFHQPQFRVLVITTSLRRLATIRATVAKQTDKVFWFADFPSINRAGFWSPLWLRPTGDHRHALI